MPNDQNNNRVYQINFILLVFGRMVSSMGSSVFNFALSLYVLDLTGSAAKFSMILGFSFLPLVFVNFLGGVFVDKHNKKRIMVLTDIISGFMVLVFMIMFAYYSKSIILFIGYSLILGTLQAFFGLAINASVPNWVHEEKVPQTNSTIQAIGAITNIAGPIIGALTYKAFGLQTVFLFNGIALILAGIVENFLQYHQQPSPTVGTAKGSYLDDIKVTFVYLNTRKILAFLFIFALVINFIFNSLMFLVLPYINYHVIKVSGFQLSLIQASGALGVVLGALMISMRSDHTFFLKKFFTLFRWQAILILLWLFPILPVFSGTNKWPIAIVFSVLLVLYGGMNTAQNIPMISYFQLKIPEELRARVFGVFWAALFVTTPLGLWIYGLLLTKIKWFYVTLSSGILMIILGLLFASHKYFKEFVAEFNNQEKV